LPVISTTALKPRKTPMQARSAASVDAILQATIQVLLAVGKERLTTTRVAARAGVSVGTLYQYFPNKSSLLQACLRRHIEKVADAIQQTCREYPSLPLADMATAIISSFLAAKMRDVRESAALYSVSSDIDGAAIAKASSNRSRLAVAALFATTSDTLIKGPEVIATVVLAAINGISRRLLEANHPERELTPLHEELVVLVHAYLRTCITE
jgi:AcrR family transcriptional regulator